MNRSTRPACPARFLAMPTSPAEMSSPVTRPSGATAGFIWRQSRPLPQPISSRLSPGPGASTLMSASFTCNWSAARPRCSSAEAISAISGWLAIGGIRPIVDMAHNSTPNAPTALAGLVRHFGFEEYMEAPIPACSRIAPQAYRIFYSSSKRNNEWQQLNKWG